MKKALFFSLTAMFLAIGVHDAAAQCGPEGLSPCVVPKVIRPAVKAVVKKGKTVKKNASAELNKIAAPKTKSSKTAKDGTSIYDSLKLDPKVVEAASAPNELFPLNGVTLGKTTESQMRLLGGERNVYADTQTGESKIYYNIEERNFWLRDGVADSVGFFNIDGMPAKWQLLGFNFGMSLKESAALLKKLGYEVQMNVALPKFEDIGKEKTYAGFVRGTKAGAVPILVGMNFTLGNGKNMDSRDTMFYFAVSVKH